MYYESSGNIKAQIGRSLDAIRLRVEAGDVLGVADHLSLLVAICSPKLSPEERQELAIPPLEGGKDRHGEKSRRLFESCMNRLATLLCILSDKGLYSFKDVEIGDASELALSDPIPIE